MDYDVGIVRQRRIISADECYFAAPGGVPDTQAFLNFQARSSLDGAHTTYYRTFLNGLTTDGLFNSDGTSSIFDILYLLATQDTTTALLNLVSTSFGATANGSPTFTTDRGYTGVDASSTVFLDTNYNASTQGTNYSANNAHGSVWSVTDVQSTAAGGDACGILNAAANNNTHIVPRYSDNTAAIRINEGAFGSTYAVGNATGHWLANRTGLNTTSENRNGSSLGSNNITSVPLANGNMYILARNRLGTGAESGYAGQMAAMSAGAGMTATQITNFYNRLRTYMTSVGVP